MANAVIMPKAGITVESCIMGQWLKNVGDQVKVGDILFTYETDKASFECESTAEGTLLEIFFEEGDEVPCLVNVCAVGNPGEDCSALKGGSGAPAAEAAPERTESVGFSGKVLNINSNKPSVVLFRPTRYGECTKAADDLRSRKAVIVNMEDVDANTACRVVDFLSGCAYALDGKVRKIATDTYLFCPQSMDVMGDLETIQTEIESHV